MGFHLIYYLYPILLLSLKTKTREKQKKKKNRMPQRGAFFFPSDVQGGVF